MKRFLVMVLVVVALFACDDGGPRDPVWHKQACAHCKMLLSDARYAGQVLTGDQEHLFFDDIGCMIEYLETSLPPKGSWVRSENGWIDARTARYASGAASPMDYGFAPDARGALDYSAVRASVAQQRAER